MGTSQLQAAMKCQSGGVNNLFNAQESATNKKNSRRSEKQSVFRHIPNRCRCLPYIEKAALFKGLFPMPTKSEITAQVTAASNTTRRPSFDAGAQHLACFPADTCVMTPQGNRDICDIVPGDLVLSRNEHTGETAYRKVLRTFEHENVQLFHVIYKSASGRRIALLTTAEHPFWVQGIGWKKAQDLVAGDRLSCEEGEDIVVDGVNPGFFKQTVYNFEVEEFHTYFVTPRGIWVHNKQPIATGT